MPQEQHQDNAELLDPVSALIELNQELCAQTEKYRTRLRHILDASAGHKLPSAEELRRFKLEFKRATAFLGVHPVLPDGERATLQVFVKGTRAWPRLMGRAKSTPCRVAANTVPQITLGDVTSPDPG